MTRSHRVSKASPLCFSPAMWKQILRHEIFLLFRISSSNEILPHRGFYGELTILVIENWVTIFVLEFLVRHCVFSHISFSGFIFSWTHVLYRYRYNSYSCFFIYAVISIDWKASAGWCAFLVINDKWLLYLEEAIKRLLQKHFIVRSNMKVW